MFTVNDFPMFHASTDMGSELPQAPIATPERRWIRWVLFDGLMMMITWVWEQQEHARTMEKKQQKSKIQCFFV